MDTELQDCPVIEQRLVVGFIWAEAEGVKPAAIYNIQKPNISAKTFSRTTYKNNVTDKDMKSNTQLFWYPIAPWDVDSLRIHEKKKIMSGQKRKEEKCCKKQSLAIMATLGSMH